VREDLINAREEHIERLTASGVALYPTWHSRTHDASDVQKESVKLIESKTVVTIAGRLSGKRKHGGSTFGDISDGSGKIQILFRRNIIGEENYGLLEALDLGDIVAVSGELLKRKQEKLL